MESDVTKRDPVTDALVSRGVMLIIGFLFIAFVALLFIALEAGMEGFLSSAGSAFDAWQYLLYVIASFACLPLIASFKYFLMPGEDKKIKREISRQFGIFSISTKDGTSQLKHALLMWLLVFVPLDLLSYLIPGMLDFQTRSLIIPPAESDPGQGLYFSVSIFGIFLGLSILVHLFVATREEIMFRGVMQFWGQKNVGFTSSVVISALAFGLSHFSYWFSPLGQSDPIFFYFALWWGAAGLFVGFMLGFYLRTTGRILPMILAHWWNNVVSTIAVWMYVSNNNAISTMSYLGWVLYLPLIVCGLVLAILWWSTILKAGKLVKKEVKSYLNQPRYEIFFDIIFGLGFWVVLLLI
ncbi:MAG: hypothetical protein RBG13Loki_4430 [Promethearchaeota archaeon CR_4]|nr:MAG: hypothetical protein RBG13Loki_4430 [Candidatus Lokiarchaeota archaeon CR_4]